MKKIWLLFVGMLMVGGVKAQGIYICRNAAISFYSSAPIEDIEAQTEKGVSAINLQTGSVYFKVPIQTFQFERGMMQDHFNSDYLESDKFPYAEFKGNLVNFSPTDTDGVYPVTVEGQLSIHGVTKDYKTAGTLEISQGKITAISTFKVRLADHQIKIPKLLFNNIAEVVDIKVNAVYDPQKEAATPVP